jgi:Uma2 family endonuclease
MATTADTAATSDAPPAANAIPPLENGDRLTRPEFERRYDAMPHLKKAELIKGIVYMPSPVNHKKHANPHFALITWLGQYQMFTPGVEGGDNGSLRLDLESEPQPDAYLLIAPTHGGQARIDADGYVAGAPELVAEVAASSVSYDLHDKLDVYRDNGAREYIAWRVLDQAVDWFVLRKGRYEPLLVDEAGLYKSGIFPGLWLDPAALVRGDLPAVLQALQQGPASPEHAAFVARLQQKGEQSH